MSQIKQPAQPAGCPSLSWPKISRPNWLPCQTASSEEEETIQSRVRFIENFPGALRSLSKSKILLLSESQTAKLRSLRGQEEKQSIPECHLNI